VTMFLTDKEAWKKTLKDPFIWIFGAFLICALIYELILK
jgi:hypothetical protein